MEVSRLCGISQPTIRRRTRVRKAGLRFYDGLMLQLRSMGPGLWADRWLFEQVPELRGLQAAVLQSQVQQNVLGPQAQVRVF